MIKKYTHKSIVWVDVENPTKEEIRSLVEEYNIDGEIASDLHLPSSRNYKEKVFVYKDYIYTEMHFPALRHSHTQEIDQEIDFIVGKNFIITTRYETIDALEQFAKDFEVNDILNRNLMEGNAGSVLYYLLRELYISIADELDSINDELKQIEKNLFQGNEKKLVADISHTNRDLIHLNHTVLSHKEILQHIENVGEKIFDKNFPGQFNAMLDEYYRIENALIHNIAFLTEMRNTNDSLLSLKQGETMKTLTIMAFVTFPLTLVSSIFGMNTKDTPIVGMNGDFWVVVGIMLILAGTFFTFFKMKKWL
jgi:magnesium transporter